MTRNMHAERWSRRPKEQRAWVKERLAAIDPYRTNAWTDALDDAIAVLDDADKRAAAEPELCTACGKPMNPHADNDPRCSSCVEAGVSAEPVTCHHGIVGGSSGLCSNCEAEPEAKAEPCLTEDCGNPRVEGWRWCRRCMDSECSRCHR